jgi:uncharacterized protein (DUF1330 family)
MGRFDSYVITWGDEGPLPAGQAGSLAAAAGAHGGELLALGPVHDCSERDSRPVPAWVAIAGFGDEAAATAWFGQAAEQLGPATVLAPALTEPVWWPPDLEPWRPGWSRSLEVPRARLGLFVTIWAELTDPPQFLDYASKFKWTVEHDGGVVLAGAPFPRVLAGGSGRSHCSAGPQTRRRGTPGTTGPATTRTSSSGTGRLTAPSSASWHSAAAAMVEPARADRRGRCPS